MTEGTGFDYEKRSTIQQLQNPMAQPFIQMKQFVWLGSGDVVVSSDELI